MLSIPRKRNSRWRVRTGSFRVSTTPNDCRWTASCTLLWVHRDGQSGTGDGVVTFYASLDFLHSAEDQDSV